MVNFEPLCGRELGEVAVHGDGQGSIGCNITHYIIANLIRLRNIAQHGFGRALPSWDFYCLNHQNTVLLLGHARVFQQSYQVMNWLETLHVSLRYINFTEHRMFHLDTSI